MKCAYVVVRWHACGGEDAPWAYEYDVGVTHINTSYYSQHRRDTYHTDVQCDYVIPHTGVEPEEHPAC